MSSVIDSTFGRIIKIIFSILSDMTGRVGTIYYNTLCILIKPPKPQINIKEMLKGPKAFYEDIHYKDNLTKELEGKSVPSLVYVYQSGRWNAMKWIVKDLFSIFSLFFVWRIVHSWIGKFAILPSSTPPLLGFFMNAYKEMRPRINTDHFKMKRVRILVEGIYIDAMIVGTPKTFASTRWTLFASGNGEFFELLLLFDKSLSAFIENLETNAIFFNYPGVADSQGLPNRKLMVSTQRAVLQFLEDPINGVGAKVRKMKRSIVTDLNFFKKNKEIIMWGHSIGGATQGEALYGYSFRTDVKYLFIKSRSFSNLKQVAFNLTHSRILSWGVYFGGWNISPLKSSLTLKQPEMILQTIRTNSSTYTQYRKGITFTIIHDGIIYPEASLAYALLNSPMNDKLINKFIYGLYEGHNDGIGNPSQLASLIKDIMKKTFKSE